MATKIEINDHQYCLKNKFEDLTFGEWASIQYVLSQREIKPNLEKFNDGTEQVEYFPLEQETEGFKSQKYIKILNICSKIPLELFDEYPELLELLLEQMESLSPSIDNAKTTIDCDGELWYFPNLFEITFQQWCDIENMLSNTIDKETNLVKALAVTLTNKKHTYNRFHSNLGVKIALFEQLLALEVVSSFNSFLSEMQVIRSTYKHLYSVESPDTTPSPNVDKHSEMFGWEEIVRTLAEKQVFNSPMGTLQGVRTANCLEVLEFLNISRAKSIAEMADQKYLQSKNKQQI